MLEEKRNFNTRNDGEIVSLDDLVPKFHLLRKIDKSIDWKMIYPIVEGKYSKIGRPSVDPVVLVKMVMLQHIYGIRSLRQTVAEIEVNVAYRWFIGYGLTEKIPHFSTVSYNFLHRFDSEMFEEIFTIAVPTGTAVIGRVVEGVVAGFMNVEQAEAFEVYFDNETSIILGVMFIVVSLLCRYGAEIKEKGEAV